MSVPFLCSIANLSTPAPYLPLFLIITIPKKRLFLKKKNKVSKNQKEKKKKKKYTNLPVPLAFLEIHQNHYSDCS
jgi:hypothetical protein